MKVLSLLSQAAFIVAVAVAPHPRDCDQKTFPFVVSNRGGVCYFKMSPDQGGRGYCYRVGVGEQDTLLWKTSEWYSYTVFLSDDGVYLIRLRGLAAGEILSEKNVAIAFYKSGELLKAYSVEDVVQDVSYATLATGYAPFLAEPPPILVTDPAHLEPELSFRLTSTDGIQYVFDVRTGSAVSVKAP